MIYLKYDSDYRVVYRHNMPFDAKEGLGKTTEQLEKEGVLVDSIPEASKKDGKDSVMYINPTKKEIYYKYEDVPQTEEDLTKEEIAQLKADNGELLIKQAMQEIELIQSKQDIGELMMKVATLEMGGNI